ncbi:MAG TPA: hypothetical protein VGJ98_00455 [Candidatus Eisenbacteria bacterium]
MTALPAASLLTLAAVGLLFAGDSGEKPPVAVAQAGPGGASDLTLAPGLSFTDDSSSAFPIRGENLTDGKIASDRPTAIFFGTSHCWNTNREAERFVAFYRKHKDDARFLVVDLSSPSPDQRALVTRYSTGYIPTLAFLDRRGNVVYNRAGETARERGDISALERILLEANTH